MINFDQVTGDNRHARNLEQPQITDRPYRILTVGLSGSRKKNALVILIRHQQNDKDFIDKAFLYAKDQYEPKYQYFI